MQGWHLHLPRPRSAVHACSGQPQERERHIFRVPNTMTCLSTGLDGGVADRYLLHKEAITYYVCITYGSI
jgi:hypothetical protein